MPPPTFIPIPASLPNTVANLPTPRMAATSETILSNFPAALALSSLAGASTGIGALITVLHPSFTLPQLGLWQGAAAGFMLSVSADLANPVLTDLDKFPAFVFFLTGGVLFMLLKSLVPTPEKDGVLRSGLLTAATISLHNFPEGVAVCVASLRGVEFGVPLAIAIGLHNIPEGMAVALPLFFATKDRAYAVKMAFLSGLAEPAGVLFVLIGIHLLGDVTHAAVAAGMAGVAGVMVVLSLAELVPQAITHAGKQGAILSTMLGFFVMTGLLWFIQSLGLGV